MIVYDVATGSCQKISETGEKPRWLSDSRRLLQAHESKAFT